MSNKRHAKPTAAALAERTYRKVLKFHSTLLNQMAHIRLDIAAARREDRTELMEELAIIKRRAAEAADAQEHVRILAEHCERLLREKETLQRQLYAVKEMKTEALTPTPQQLERRDHNLCHFIENHRLNHQCSACGYFEIDPTNYVS